jgi:hypothetical protein
MMDHPLPFLRVTPGFLAAKAGRRRLPTPLLPAKAGIQAEARWGGGREGTFFN